MESYEQKYKAALERASKLRFQNPFDTVSQMMEHVFPELKESEDERIRKEIISHLQHECVVKRYVSDVEYDRWIDWLEKQGKPKWTDEDEERLQSCIIALQGKGLMGGVDTMDSKWLKSLKQRMEE